MTSNRRDWLLFTGWLLTGACYLLALISVLSIGIFILPIPVAGTVALPAADAAAIAERFGIAFGDLAPLTERLLRISPELLAESVPEKFPDTGEAVRFWQVTWAALRQAERYVPLQGPATSSTTQGSTAPASTTAPP